MATAAALKGFLAILRAEQQKRARSQGRAIGMTREQFYEMLDLTAERRRAAPGYVEPTPAQRALALQDLDRYLRSRAKQKSPAETGLLGLHDRLL
jgi:hypothetical protein